MQRHVPALPSSNLSIFHQSCFPFSYALTYTPTWHAYTRSLHCRLIHHRLRLTVHLLIFFALTFLLTTQNLSLTMSLYSSPPHLYNIVESKNSIPILEFFFVDRRNVLIDTPHVDTAKQLKNRIRVST